MKIKTLFFDMGNVLINFDINMLQQGYSRYCSELSDDLFFNYMMDSPELNAYMEGRISSDDFYFRTIRKFGLKGLTREEFYSVWNSMFFPSENMEALVDRIIKEKPYLNLVLVTNINEEHYRFVRKNFPVLEKMHAQVASHIVGRMKPHREIFDHALNIYQNRPEEVFYTDDRPDLVAPARELGINAWCFTGYDDLRRELEQQEIMT